MPAASATTMSSAPGLLRLRTSSGSSSVEGASAIQTISHEITILQPAAIQTVSIRTSALPTHPITIDEAMPRMGVISGATSMAAITTAPEFRSRPIVAMITASDSSKANLRQ